MPVVCCNFGLILYYCRLKWFTHSFIHPLRSLGRGKGRNQPTPFVPIFPRLPRVWKLSIFSHFNVWYPVTKPAYFRGRFWTLKELNHFPPTHHSSPPTFPLEYTYVQDWTEILFSKTSCFTGSFDISYLYSICYIIMFVLWVFFSMKTLSDVCWSKTACNPIDVLSWTNRSHATYDRFIYLFNHVSLKSGVWLVKFLEVYIMLPITFIET